MKKLCIFDFDGTLFDSLPDVAKCFNLTLEKLGYETLDLSYYIKVLGGNIDEILSLILKDNDKLENMELLKNTYEDIYLNDVKENTKLFDGMYELLKKLQEKGFILAINSNRKRDSIETFTKKYTEDIEFIDIQGHEYNHPSKPDPYGVNTILQKAGVKKEETIYIGDSITDIKTAQNAHIDCILVRWGYGVGDVYENEYPLAVVNDADDILRIVMKD